MSATQLYATGTVLTIIEGAVTPTFRSYAQGATVIASGTNQPFTISYNNTGGNVSVTLTAALANTTTTLTGPTTIVTGQPALYTVSVINNGVGFRTPTGSVSLFDGNNVLVTGSLTAGSVSLQVSSLGLGTHTLTAVYFPDNTHNGSSATLSPVNVVLPSFSDSFAGTGPSPLGSQWAEVPNPKNTYNPEFQIVNNYAVPQNTGPKQLNEAILSGVTSSNASVSVTISFNDSASDYSFGGVIARLNNGNTQSYAGLVQEFGGDLLLSLSLVTVSNTGVFTTILQYVDFGSVQTANGILTLDLSGTSLSLFFTGTVGSSPYTNLLVGSATDTTLLAPGGIGIVDNGGYSSFQNFSVATGTSFSDTFQRSPAPPPAVPLGNAWSNDPNNGGFKITQGTSRNLAVPVAISSSPTVSVLTGVNSSTLDVQATLASSSILSSGSGAGLVVQWNPATLSGYALLLTSNELQLVKISGGAITQTVRSVSVSGVDGQDNKLELQATASTLTVYLNRLVKFTVTDETPGPKFTSGTGGLIDYGTDGEFSDFTLYGL